MPEHDPFNEPETAHPRARDLMAESFFWDCVDEAARFGSDEVSDDYYEWRNWREDNPAAPAMSYTPESLRHGVVAFWVNVPDGDDWHRDSSVQYYASGRLVTIHETDFRLTPR